MSVRPILIGVVWGIVIGATSATSSIPTSAKVLFGLGLLLNYASIGALVAWLPRRGPRWLFGLVVGALYSLPGALITAVPVPLAQGADRYYRNFVAGGGTEAAMTFFFGSVVGVSAGLALRKSSLPPSSQS